ncbi:MAG TPA: hypothetical protein VEQ59_12980 [Polyangiaceae bacterium]|nr:hypothetical protein [Polyangiaceae bacterium]
MLLAAVVAPALLGCASPGSQRIVGPDGSPMAHVHCGSDQGTCFRIAGEICPNGYEMKPVMSGHDGNFLVSCRAPRAVAQVAPSCVAPTTAAAPAVTSLMSPYPWPPPQATAAQRSTSLPAATAPSAEIDLGY